MPFKSFSKVEVGQFFRHDDEEWVKVPLCHEKDDNVKFNAYQTRLKKTHLPFPEQTAGVRIFDEAVLVRVGNVPRYAKWANDTPRNNN